MIDDVKRTDATLSELEVINELTSTVEVGHRFAELAQEDVRETAGGAGAGTASGGGGSAAAVERRRDAAAGGGRGGGGGGGHLVKRDALELERRRNVLDDVVGATPVTPRLVEAVQVAGRHERTHDVRRVRVRRSLRQQRHLSSDERVQLSVAPCADRQTHRHVDSTISSLVDYNVQLRIPEN